MYQRFWKRLLDLVLSALAILVLSPLLLAVALWVRLDSRGPVLFRQKRVGKRKTYFSIYKFRTMYMDAPADMPTHLLQNADAMITRSGHFLRRSSLDELPQLFNIFLGQMSFVGPRPALWNQNDLIEQRDRYGANELTPGLTGLAQVSGRDELPIAVKAAYDGEYVKKIGLWTDIRILFATFFGVLKADGVVEGRVDDPPETGAAKEETET